jgi:hypothetical protein
MIGKFGLNEVFTTVEEKDPRNSYHLDTIVQTNDNEDKIEVAT